MGGRCVPRSVEFSIADFISEFGHGPIHSAQNTHLGMEFHQHFSSFRRFFRRRFAIPQHQMDLLKQIYGPNELALGSRRENLVKFVKHSKRNRRLCAQRQPADDRCHDDARYVVSAVCSILLSLSRCILQESDWRAMISRRFFSIFRLKFFLSGPGTEIPVGGAAGLERHNLNSY